MNCIYDADRRLRARYIIEYGGIVAAVTLRKNSYSSGFFNYADECWTFAGILIGTGETPYAEWQYQKHNEMNRPVISQLSCLGPFLH